MEISILFIEDGLLLLMATEPLYSSMQCFSPLPLKQLGKGGKRVSFIFYALIFPSFRICDPTVTQLLHKLLAHSQFQGSGSGEGGKTVIKCLRSDFIMASTAWKGAFGAGKHPTVAAVDRRQAAAFRKINEMFQIRLPQEESTQGD